MYARKDRRAARVGTRRRIRGRVDGTATKPRLAVFRSHQNIYVQAIDDLAGCTLATASTRESELKAEGGGGGNIAAAKVVGEAIAKRLLTKGIDTVVFDRGGFVYHGRVKALADAAREGGLKF